MSKEGRGNFKMRKEKGITLVALIITIVVMLILVAVSVNVIVNSDLIGHAEKTGDAYRNAIAEEERYNPSIGNGKTLEDYMKDAKIVEEIHNWVRTGDNLTCKCNQCTENGAKPEGRTLTIGQQLNYTKTGTGSSKISGDMSGVKQGIADENLTASDFGKNGEQTINKDAETKWVVLGAKDVNESGTNETLLLTTLKPTTKTIRLYGAAAYNNGPTEINRMCRELYGKDARGMTIEDVNNCLAYRPAGGMYNDKSGNVQTVNNLTTKLSSLPIWNDIKNNHQTPDGRNTEEALGEYPLNGYWYVADSTVGASEGVPVLPDSTTTATKTLIFGTDNSYLYWLASRGVIADSGCASFGPGAVGEGGAYSYDSLFFSSGFSYDVEFPLRAVVSLRSDIPARVK